MSTFASLLVLRGIRDWHDTDNLAAFSGDPEKQFHDLFREIRDIIIKSGLLDHCDCHQERKDHWMKGLEEVENRYEEFSKPQWFWEDRGKTH